MNYIGIRMIESKETLKYNGEWAVKEKFVLLYDGRYDYDIPELTETSGMYMHLGISRQEYIDAIKNYGGTLKKEGTGKNKFKNDLEEEDEEESKQNSKFRNYTQFKDYYQAINFLENFVEPLLVSQKKLEKF